MGTIFTLTVLVDGALRLVKKPLGKPPEEKIYKPDTPAAQALSLYAGLHTIPHSVGKFVWLFNDADLVS